MNAPDTILVIEDDPVLGPALAQRLRLEGFQPALVTTRAAAVQVIDRNRPAAIVSDIRLPDGSGEEVFRHVISAHGILPVFFMTAFGEVSQAVRLVKAGARDYQTKPIDVDRLVDALRAACHEQEPSPLDRELGVSPAMRAVEATLRKAARVDVPVLITGETGVGKEVAANFLHQMSAVAAEPFVAVNCAALPRELVESTLFGHEKGAFTGAVAKRAGLVEKAGHGVLFLDEIGDLAFDLQAKLLRLIQERTFLSVGSDAEKRFHARLICATNADLPQRIRDGKFREDLYYRLNVVEIRIPPLRERHEDIPSLADQFITEAAARFGVDPRPVSNEAICALQSHPWPGNVRELRNRVERAMALSDNSTLLPLDLFPERRLDDTRDEAGPISLDRMVDEAVRAQITEALRRADNNRGGAARLLGISRTTLWKRMRDLGLD